VRCGADKKKVLLLVMIMLMMLGEEELHWSRSAAAPGLRAPMDCAFLLSKEPGRFCLAGNEALIGYEL
jgi:hypothetical protein